MVVLLNASAINTVNKEFKSTVDERGGRESKSVFRL